MLRSLYLSSQAANLHSVFGAFSSARGMVQVLRGAGRGGADALNVSVLAQVRSHSSSGETL